MKLYYDVSLSYFSAARRRLCEFLHLASSSSQSSAAEKYRPKIGFRAWTYSTAIAIIKVNVVDRKKWRVALKKEASQDSSLTSNFIPLFLTWEVI